MKIQYKFFFIDVVRNKSVCYKFVGCDEYEIEMQCKTRIVIEMRAHAHFTQLLSPIKKTDAGWERRVASFLVADRISSRQ